jgi:hypothetical protein
MAFIKVPKYIILLVQSFGDVFGSSLLVYLFEDLAPRPQTLDDIPPAHKEY